MRHGESEGSPSYSLPLLCFGFSSARSFFSKSVFLASIAGARAPLRCRTANLWLLLSCLLIVGAGSFVIADCRPYAKLEKIMII
mmetsp:Transcript_58711/g.91292  ORF Transcript_58711/g.91292 Transcript_58711/m.91292 type:complete len:84 (-) Transcript_58711:41-292(-)